MARNYVERLRDDDDSQPMEEAPLTEHELVPCLHMTGSALDTAYGAVRVVFWNHVPTIGGQTEERRIIARLAMSRAVAHRLLQQLNAALMKDIQ